MLWQAPWFMTLALVLFILFSTLCSAAGCFLSPPVVSKKRTQKLYSNVDGSAFGEEEAVFENSQEIGHHFANFSNTCYSQLICIEIGCKQISEEANQFAKAKLFFLLAFAKHWTQTFRGYFPLLPGSTAAVGVPDFFCQTKVDVCVKRTSFLFRADFSSSFLRYCLGLFWSTDRLGLPLVSLLVQQLHFGSFTYLTSFISILCKPGEPRMEGFSSIFQNEKPNSRNNGIWILR